MSCNDAGLTGKQAQDISQVWAIIQMGNSNASGSNADPNGSNDPPFGVPTSGVTMFRRIPAGVNPAISDSILQNLKVTTTAFWTYHGAELAMGLTLMSAAPAGVRVAILKASSGGSAIADWIEGGPLNAGLQTAITDFTTLLNERYPNATILWNWTVNCGDIEARDSEAAASAWASNFATMKTQMESYVGATLRPLIVQTWDGLAAAPWIAIVRAQEATAAAASNGYLIDVDSVIDVNIQSDDIHWTGNGQNIVGATLYAPTILTDIGP